MWQNRRNFSVFVKYSMLLFWLIEHILWCDVLLCDVCVCYCCYYCCFCYRWFCTSPHSNQPMTSAFKWETKHECTKLKSATKYTKHFYIHRDQLPIRMKLTAYIFVGRRHFIQCLQIGQLLSVPKFRLSACDIFVFVLLFVCICVSRRSFSLPPSHSLFMSTSLLSFFYIHLFKFFFFFFNFFSVYKLN